MKKSSVYHSAVSSISMWDPKQAYYLSFYVSICLSICPSICLSNFLSLCLYTHIHTHTHRNTHTIKINTFRIGTESVWFDMEAIFALSRVLRYSFLIIFVSFFFQAQLVPLLWEISSWLKPGIIISMLYSTNYFVIYCYKFW